MNHLPRSTGVLVIAVLLALSAGAAAREVHMQGPNSGGGTCPDARIDDNSSAPAPQVPKRVAARDKAKAAPMLRSGGDNSDTSRPRWHSILPGMFR
jgi:hypothetical protein